MSLIQTLLDKQMADNMRKNQLYTNAMRQAERERMAQPPSSIGTDPYTAQKYGLASAVQAGYVPYVKGTPSSMSDRGLAAKAINIDSNYNMTGNYN